MQVSTTTRYREHRVCPWRSALWEGLSPAWFCMVTFAPYSTKVCQKGRDMGSYRGLLLNIFNDCNRRLNGDFLLFQNQFPEPITGQGGATWRAFSSRYQTPPALLPATPPRLWRRRSLGGEDVAARSCPL